MTGMDDDTILLQLDKFLLTKNPAFRSQRLVAFCQPGSNHPLPLLQKLGRLLKCQEKDIELQAEEMEEKFPHVNAICQEIKAKYEYADADYMVVVPDGILDIITEGRALHHCAGSSDRYWDRIERRESFVVFLRKTADPFHAYYTLEVEPDGTVRQ